MRQHKIKPFKKLRLYCFPYAGAGASTFYPWKASLSPEIDLCPVQLPGREQRFKEPPLRRICDVVKELATAFISQQDIPFAFFGHSVGALIAFELAREIYRAGNQGLIHLWVSGCRAPQLPETNPPIHDLPDAAFLDELRCIKGTQEAILSNNELMQLLLPTLRADFEIYETYVYTAGNLLPCSISAFGGFDDIRVREADLLAWGKNTSRSFSYRRFPGGHFFLHTSQSHVLEVLSDQLHTLTEQGRVDR